MKTVTPPDKTIPCGIVVAVPAVGLIALVVRKILWS